MNNKLLIILSLMIVLVLAIIVTIFWRVPEGVDLPVNPTRINDSVNQNTPEIYTDFNTNVLPINSISTVNVPTDRGAVKVTDITKVPEVTPVGDGAYSLEGTRSDKNAGFSLVYYEEDNSYAIAILKEPVAENRIAASQYLLELLQISEEDACKLNVYIGTIYSVNEALSGQNFGLSFCPDAVEL